MYAEQEGTSKTQSMAGHGLLTKYDLQTTVNLKKVELPVKQIVSGRIVKPSGTLLNPKSLDYYYQFAKVEDVVGKQRIGKSKL
jgi:acetoacetyl-CoA synthetase